MEKKEPKILCVLSIHIRACMYTDTHTHMHAATKHIRKYHSRCFETLAQVNPCACVRMYDALAYNACILPFKKI